MKRKPPLMCRQPDRHEPRMTCGYPLPCPFHTVVADVKRQVVEFPVGGGIVVQVPAEKAGRVGQVTKALRPKGKP